MNKNSKLIYIIIIFAALLEISCSLKSPYIGKRYNTSNWCKYPIFSSCKYNKEHVIITVNKLDLVGEGEYSIVGFMELKGISASFKSVSLKDTTFYLVLAKDHTVVETKRFFPGRIEMHTKFPFTLKFKSPAFDSYNFNYEIRVSSQQQLT